MTVSRWSPASFVPRQRIGDLELIYALCRQVLSSVTLWGGTILGACDTMVRCGVATRDIDNNIKRSK